jgi:hypothetical protein
MAFEDSLFRDEELVDGKPPGESVVVEGIMHTVGFHPGRLEGHREEVVAWLNQLPDEFKAQIGGGWSFLNMCYDRDGNQWTGLHQVMEQLLLLGIGLRRAKIQLPREMWNMVPGGMPYIVVTKE